jgi:hypothetical protein
MFHYGHLSPDDREIRLVRFVGGANESQGSYSLQLVTASLNDNPSYSAVSYVWGTSTPIIPIRLNDKSFQIAQNLHYALGQLSQNLRYSEWLWIDAICIDQNNFDERSWQVAQMRDIFQDADLVYICLGNSANDSALIMDLAQSFGREAKAAGVLELWTDFPSKVDRVPTVPDIPNEDSTFTFIAKLLACERFLDRRVPGAVTSLLNRPNWFRSWIVQEISLAGQGRVLCGNHSIDLDEFHATLTAIYFAKISRFARQHPRWNNFGAGFNNNIFHLRCLLVRRLHSQGKHLTLLELLLSEMRGASESRPFYAASDARDIIYALLGIAGDTDLLGIRPDYRKPVEQVYAAVTKAMITHCSGYRLEYCSFRKETPRLPSWAPDWRRIGRLGIEVHPLSYPANFNATRGRKQPTIPEINEMTLCLRGYCIDVAAAVFAFGEAGEYVSNLQSQELTLSTALLSRKARSRCLKSIYEFTSHNIYTRASESDLWRTMVGGWMGIEKCTPQFDTLACLAFQEQVASVDSLSEAERAYILRNTPPYPRELNPGEDLQPLIDLFCDRIVDNAARRVRGRTLFVTSGGMLGLGPYCLRKGDVATVLFGTQVPIILRPSGQRYVYLGESYIEGIMEGEGMEFGRDEVDFEII